MTALGIVAPTAGAYDVVGVGVNAIDHLCTVATFPTFDSKQTLAAYDVQPGGQVATALVALQRWGNRTVYVGTFGDGPLGELSRRSLADEGIDVTPAPTRSGVANQTAVILVDAASGERTILMHRPAALALRVDELDRALVTSARVLHVDGYDAEATLTAASWARAAGIPVVVDVDTGVDGVERLLAMTDAVILGREFACGLTGTTDVDAALTALVTMTRAPLVAITLGAEGAVARTNAGTFRVPGYVVTPIDTTGAGDVFRAGFIHGLLRAWPLERTLRFANASAALKCTKLGGRPGITTVEAAERLMGEP
ncbi:MAG: carbohydrate kinase family protein [Candidatus Binatia bacterium]